jgi:hypothetical protein
MRQFSHDDDDGDQKQHAGKSAPQELGRSSFRQRAADDATERCHEREGHHDCPIETRVAELTQEPGKRLQRYHHQRRGHGAPDGHAAV